MSAAMSETRRGWVLSAKLAPVLVAGVFAGVLWACGSDNDEPSGVPDAAAPPAQSSERATVLSEAGACLVGLYETFAQQAAALAAATSAWAAAPADSALQAAAQEAWKQAMATWQQAEVWQVGPAARSGQPGGQDLRDRIYLLHKVNRCQLEQYVASAPPIDSVFPQSRGLGALEYLLFYTGSDNACQPQVLINAQGTWAALGAAGVVAAKASFARAVADDIAANANALLSAWKPEGGDFLAQFTLRAASPYASQQEALNALNAALFYVDEQVKHMKLQSALEPDTCATLAENGCVESPYALTTLSNIENNLIGFEKAYAGCGEAGVGFGFEDLLRSIGAVDLADRMTLALAAARQAVAGVAAPDLNTALAQERSRVEAIYTAVKALVDLFESEFITVLDLDPPMSQETDND